MLSEKENVTDQLIVENIEDAQLDEDLDSDDIDNLSEYAAVPDILACNNEIEQLCQKFEEMQNLQDSQCLQSDLQSEQQHLTILFFHNMPLNEFNNTHSLLF
ncbi:hypothetical protein EMPG_09780 [Blastomyces silverae]|uniref:Uncharacterized protein n=1 Tax=Blastomyces silverae TaxID=2060906 RepID=A0A0H1BHG9_9EURO|nr:hypothetical protein EMPG_09780 [Blastomyces silverae]